MLACVLFCFPFAPPRPTCARHCETLQGIVGIDEFEVKREFVCAFSGARRPRTYTINLLSVVIRLTRRAIERERVVRLRYTTDANTTHNASTSTPSAAQMSHNALDSTSECRKE